MPFGNIVPLKFQALSGIDSYAYRVIEAWPHPYQWVWGQNREPEEIPVAAFCVVRYQESESLCLFPRSAAPGVFEAILLAAQTRWVTTRVEKFLTPYRALEGLAVKPSLNIRAIRHALAHATTQLRAPEVVEALEAMFGGTTIDCQLHSHRKHFYRHLGAPLQALDRTLQATLLKRQGEWLVLRSQAALVNPYHAQSMGLAISAAG